MAVFCAKGGVEPQSETVWRQANKYGVPRIAFVNKMDILAADFYNVVHMIIDRLNANAVPVQLPIGSEENFVGIVDLVENHALIYTDDMGTHSEITEIPGDMAELAEKYRGEMIEAAAEYDEELMELYLEGGEIPPDVLRRALRAGTIEMGIVPVLCGTAYRNKGVQPLLDAVVYYLPSPLDIDAVVGTDPDTGDEIALQASDDEPFSALAFKIMTDPFVGKLAFFRVYSGTLKAGDTVYNSTKEKRERLGRILRMHANHRTELSEVHAGDICAAVGLKAVTTGDTLCDEKKPILLETMDFPDPVIKVAIETKTKAGQEKMGIALSKLAEEDPTFKAYTDEETGQTIIAGMGELHLEIIVDRLLREFKVEATVGKPQVAYKETISRSVRAEGRYVRQSGGRGQFGHCWVEFEPGEPGSGYAFESKIVGGVIPREYIPAIEAGIQEASQNGPLGGYEVVDFKATLVDGSYHEVDSSEIAFKIAGSLAFKEGVSKAGPLLLEPIMDVEVVVPEDYMGDVMGNLNARRGRIEGMESRGGAQVVRAMVPLSEMFGYATDLRSKTQGRGTFTMQFAQYERMPAQTAEKILGKR